MGWDPGEKAVGSRRICGDLGIINFEPTVFVMSPSTAEGGYLAASFCNNCIWRKDADGYLVAVVMWLLWRINLAGPLFCWGKLDLRSSIKAHLTQRQGIVRNGKVSGRVAILPAVALGLSNAKWHFLFFCAACIFIYLFQRLLSPTAQQELHRNQGYSIFCSFGLCNLLKYAHCMFVSGVMDWFVCQHHFFHACTQFWFTNLGI